LLKMKESRPQAQASELLIHLSHMILVIQARE